MDPVWWRIWTELLGTGSGSGAVHRAACSWVSMPAVLGEEPVRFPEDHRWSESLAHAWPTGSTSTHENPAHIGVSLWTDHAGRQPAPAWPEHGLQNATTGHGQTSFQTAGAASVCADLLLTWDVPAADLSLPRGMVPITASGQRTRYLLSPDDTASVKGQLQPPLNRPVKRSAGTAAQSHDHQGRD